jgi:N-acetylglucosaminyldiphosphoundecaprenol N-acetyl-beta-D-mannosaminyltransferase
MRIVDVGGCAVGAATRREWVEHLTAAVETGRPHHHVSLNASKWVAMRRDPTLRDVVRSATSVAADGSAIVLAARGALPERVPGCDLAHDLLARAAERGWRVWLLGGGSDVAAEVARRVRALGVDVVGARDGYFGESDAAAVADAIHDARPDLVLVGMGTPRSELFVGRAVRVPLAMGVGGTFDVIAGRVRRAPSVVGRVGFEWAWRLAGAPRTRFRRAIVDSVRFATAMARGERVR